MLAQKMRWGTGACSLPPAVMESTTSEPESDEVTKKTMSRTIATSEE